MVKKYIQLVKASWKGLIRPTFIVKKTTAGAGDVYYVTLALWEYDITKVGPDPAGVKTAGVNGVIADFATATVDPNVTFDVRERDPPGPGGPGEATNPYDP